MGKFTNWVLWGFMFGIGGLILSAILNLLFGGIVNYAFMTVGHGLGIPDSLLQAVGIISGTLGLVSLVISLILSLLAMMVFWFIVGIVSFVTTPILKRIPYFKNQIWYILIPTFVLFAFPLIMIAVLLPIFGPLFDIIFVVILWLEICGEVAFYKMLKIQKYLPY